MKIILTNERPLGWNKFLRLHWTDKNEEVKRVKWLVYAAVVTKKAPLLKKRVDIVVTAYFDKKPLDASNICDKLYEDGLIGKVIVDDRPKYVRSMKTVSEIDKLNPRVEIDITGI